MGEIIARNMLSWLNLLIKLLLLQLVRCLYYCTEFLFEFLNKVQCHITSVGFKCPSNFIFSKRKRQLQSPVLFSFNSIRKYCGRVFRKFAHQSQIISANITPELSHRIYMESRMMGLFEHFKPVETFSIIHRKSFVAHICIFTGFEMSAWNWNWQKFHLLFE